jgi:hypothetical protein
MEQISSLKQPLSQINHLTDPEVIYEDGPICPICGQKRNRLHNCIKYMTYSEVVDVIDQADQIIQ